MSSSVVTLVTVCAVERLSPTFLRVTFAGPDLAEFGVDGPLLDQRIKLIFPPSSGILPRIEATDEWYYQWWALPEEERGAMRTYSIRDLTASHQLVVDFVLHLEPGSTGPASTWASLAAVGDQVIVVGPRRGVAGGGIEFDPGDASLLLLAGDETAVPAMSRILADLPERAVGHAFLEVPDPADILPLTAPAGLALHWLPRGHAPVGTRLMPAVLSHLGAAGNADVHDEEAALDEQLEDNVWETPTFSGSGEELTSIADVGNLYAWIAGESGVVTSIRRHLVKEVGLDRGQVAFMGYWRRGVAMRG